MCLSVIIFSAGNIFIHLNPKPASPESGLDEDMCEEFEPNSTEFITYKIGEAFKIINNCTKHFSGV